MSNYETFSKRQKKSESTGKPDVYQYDFLPQPFRVQVIYIWRNALGPYFGSWAGYADEPMSNQCWRLIHDTLSREMGVFSLGEGGDEAEQCEEFLLNADTNGALNIIELSFRMIDRVIRKAQRSSEEEALIKHKQNPDQAIEELNRRFQEHGIGYQYVAGELIRVDSQYVYQEVVRPAIHLLQSIEFQGALDEFLNAHEHYRNGRYKEAVAEALKALESTMKSICDTHNWEYPENATARPLIDILIKKGLIPKDLESHFGGLRTAMESGLPTISNRTSRHGQGKEPKEIPGYFAAYALHLAASNIVFLVEAHKNIK